MAVAINKGIFIVAAKRTPFGKMGGRLRDLHPSDLLAVTARDAFKAGNVSPALVDTANIGQVNTISGTSDGGLSPRHAALKSGVPQETPVLGVNRLCGSGFQAVVNSAQDILTGSAQVSLAGGTENMSAVPFLVRNARFGIPLGANIPFEDSLTAASLDTYCNFTMPQTAENLAEKYGLKRGEVDQFALQSQQRWKAGIFIIGAKRTPFCQYGGPLRELPASYAFAAAAKDAINYAKVDPALIDETVVGNIYYLSQCDGGKTPRYCGIYSGVPIEKPAVGVSKACGTGLQAIITGAVGILFGTSKFALTGGTDIMSSLPMLVRNVRFGTALGTPYIVEDHIQRDLVDSHSGITLAKISEDLAKKYKIETREMNEFAVNSHLKWKTAQDSKVFADEITSLTVSIKKKEIQVDRDQTSTTLDQLKQSEVNSSSPADGAAALLLASEEAVKGHDLSVLARIAGWTCVGVDPEETGIAAAIAVKRLLHEQRLKAGDVDLFEINETYASQVLATAKELNIPLDKINVNGGALAIGHPVSATGARMATNLVYELRRRNLKRGIATSSCGGGQGIAVMLETL